MKVGLLIMENTPTPLTRSVLIPLALTVEAPAADSGIHKKDYWVWYL